MDFVFCSGTEHAHDYSAFQLDDSTADDSDDFFAGEMSKMIARFPSLPTLEDDEPVLCQDLAGGLLATQARLQDCKTADRLRTAVDCIKTAGGSALPPTRHHNSDGPAVQATIGVTTTAQHNVTTIMTNVPQRPLPGSAVSCAAPVLKEAARFKANKLDQASPAGIRKPANQRRQGELRQNSLRAVLLQQSVKCLQAENDRLSHNVAKQEVELSFLWRLMAGSGL